MSTSTADDVFNRPICSAFFFNLLIAMILLFCTPGGAEANDYKLVEGMGYTTCEAYLKLLNSLDEPLQCEAPVDPERGFHPVEWQKLDPWADPELLYRIDTYTRPHSWAIPPGQTERVSYRDIGYEHWLWAVKREMARPEGEREFYPDLMEAEFDRDQDGKVERVLAYAPYSTTCQIRLAKGHRPKGAGYSLYVRSDDDPGFDKRKAFYVNLGARFSSVIRLGKPLGNAIYLTAFDSSIRLGLTGTRLQYSYVSLYKIIGRWKRSSRRCLFEMDLPNEPRR